MVSKIPPAEREALLAQPLIGVLSVAAEPGRAPLTTPVWHLVTPSGEVSVETPPASRKARLIEASGRFALCVQDTAAIRYATAEGPVVDVHPVTEEERLARARNYLGEEAAIAYVEATPQQSANVVITMRPDRWNTADFSQLTENLT